MMDKINIKGLLLTTANLLVSIVFSYCLTSSIVNNSDALNLVANVFSILSGFLLLVITISGDNSVAGNGLNRLDSSNQEVRFVMRFHKYYCLFLLYILTLVLIFIYYLLAKGTAELTGIAVSIRDYLSYAITFLVSFSFIQSVFIPLKIKELFDEKRKLLQK